MHEAIPQRILKEPNENQKQTQHFFVPFVGNHFLPRAHVEPEEIELAQEQKGSRSERA
jgi:hypothetical protein